MIPTEAVEAAAKAAFARTHPHGNFRLAIRELQDRYLSEARAALEAAAPYMLGPLLDDLRRERAKVELLLEGVA